MRGSQRIINLFGNRDESLVCGNVSLESGNLQSSNSFNPFDIE